MFQPAGIEKVEHQVGHQDQGKGRRKQVPQWNGDHCQQHAAAQATLTGSLSRGDRPEFLFRVVAVGLHVSDVVE